MLLSVAPRLAALPDWAVRAGYRLVFVCVTTLIAAVLPFFAAIAGLVGARGRSSGAGKGRRLPRRSRAWGTA